MVLKIRRELSNLLESYSYLLFSTNRILGAFLLVLSWINPSVGFHGFVAFLSAALFSSITGISRNSETATRYLYNSLLSGLAIGFVYAVSPSSLLLSCVVGIVTFLLSFSMHGLFSYYLGLPILNLPFALIATMVYLAAMHYSSLYHLHNGIEMSYLNLATLPAFFQGLFRSLGVLLFLPYDLVGLILLGVIFFLSRINFMLIVVAYVTGTQFHALLSGVVESGVQNPFSFNYILIALALGGFYLIPSKRTYLITLVAVAVSSILLDGMTVFWSNFGIPAFTLPFAITVLLFLHVLLLSRFPYITKSFRRTPEQNLEEWCTHKERFGTILPAPRLPFTGTWTVYQGFDDSWTHQGIWRHAVDFVIADAITGETYRGQGERLEDYFCYNKPVLAPVTGTVVVAESNLVDNPIGSVDRENSWGNHIILWSDFGYYVEISHLAKDSVSVGVGERVYAGQLIARCGNSGNSPQPHIHLQVQQWAYVGAPSILFNFSQSTSNGTMIRGEYSPVKGDRVTPLLLSRPLQHLLQFILDDRLTFAYAVNGVARGTLEVVVRMDVDGSYYLQDLHRDSRLYLVQGESEFLCTSFSGSLSSPLRFLYAALPSLPLSDTAIQWHEALPVSVVERRLPFFGSLLKSFHHRWYGARGEFSLDGMTVTGEIIVARLFSSRLMSTTVQLRAEKRFASISCKQKGEHHELTAL